MSEENSPRHLLAISLGSNIDPVANLPRAIHELQEYGRLKAASKVCESAPVGFSDQPNFLNAAVLLATEIDPQQFKDQVLRPIESLLGRVRDPGNINAPRTIDLDLAIIITDAVVTILEKDLFTRAFVAVPLAEILPDVVHPATGQTLAEIAGQFDPQGLTLRSDCDLML